jgi:hypothetical protein
VPLLLNVAIIQAVYAIVRVTTSYRAIELKLPVIWLGIISATFAILPIIFAVQVGRYLDRGKDAQAAWLGASLLVLACAGFRFAAGSLLTLLLMTALLGISHILIMASQQMLCVRCTGPRGRDAAFGNYVIASAVGQGLGPYLVAWVGGSATLPPTGRLFMIGLIVSFASLATAATIRPAPDHLTRQKSKEVVPLRALLRQRGLMAYLVASVITMAAQDLVTIYLPLLGAEKNINVRDIGSLLTVRSVAALVSRMGYVRIIAMVGPSADARQHGGGRNRLCLSRFAGKASGVVRSDDVDRRCAGDRDDVEPHQCRRSCLAGVDGHRDVAAQHRQPDRPDGGTVRRQPDRRRQRGRRHFRDYRAQPRRLGRGRAFQRGGPVTPGRSLPVPVPAAVITAMPIGTGTVIAAVGVRPVIGRRI